MKTILISGAAGFIGSHLVDEFLNEKFKVIGVDNLITGNIENIKKHSKNNNFLFINHDISKHIEIKEKIDYILHFASPASPIDYLKIPIQTLKVNAFGTYNLLGLALKNNATILVASTSEIYGDPEVHPQNESYWGNVNSVGPRSVYDEGKRFMESITMAYNKFHNINTKIVRIFNTYGPRMRLNDGRVLPSFIGQALRNEDLTVFGDGNQTRSFCYVDDLINGLILLMGSNYQKPINLGNPEELSINKLALIICNLIDQKLDIEYKSLPHDDPKRRNPCIQLAKEQLNWEPKVELKKGLIKTINWFKKIL